MCSRRPQVNSRTPDQATRNATARPLPAFIRLSHPSRAGLFSATFRNSTQTDTRTGSPPIWALDTGAQPARSAAQIRRADHDRLAPALAGRTRSCCSAAVGHHHVSGRVVPLASRPYDAVWRPAIGGYCRAVPCVGDCHLSSSSSSAFPSVLTQLSCAMVRIRTLACTTCPLSAQS
jgi:hypothetical protein